jgi:hypothetical protein
MRTFKFSTVLAITALLNGSGVKGDLPIWRARGEDGQVAKNIFE